MKKPIKYLVVILLIFLARLVVRRYRPKIVMVTGSVGKTSTKDAVAKVLAARFFVRKSEKNLNTEFGVPITIFGADVPDPLFNPFAWIPVFRNALALLLLPNHYPNMLVLEVGADKPGDMERILRIAMPDAVVVTRLPEISVHVEAYVSPEAVQEEEFSPAHALPAAAPLIVPSDDCYALRNSLTTPARVISYGFKKGSTVLIDTVGFYESDGVVQGMKASIEAAGETGQVVVKGSVGRTQIFPAAAALAVATAFSIPLAEALAALEKYDPPPGRGRIFAGKNGSVIIDDSYNASPAAVEEALGTLKSFPHAKRRIAVLGDMLELGRYSVTEHERIGVLAKNSADIVAAVGIRSRAYSAAPGSAEVILFDSSRTAAASVVDFVRPGDVVLVKGSQSVRTERIVKALLANPADASRLARQEKKWLQRS
ncbi:MAG: cyanophycin synthetase [Minisyncoccia bacterium]